ncbi:MAG: hypothetical protein H0T97_11510 [Actinobacteria bacterium]|nr:hypothetical protein [Actinomycetota bacterium]
MDKALGLLLLAGYITAIIALAAGITYAVIRIFPTERNPRKNDKDDKSGTNGDGEGQGRLFRRAKRGTA